MVERPAQTVIEDYTIVSNLVINNLVSVEEITCGTLCELRGGYNRILHQQGVPILDNDVNNVRSPGKLTDFLRILPANPV